MTPTERYCIQTGKRYNSVSEDIIDNWILSRQRLHNIDKQIEEEVEEKLQKAIEKALNDILKDFNKQQRSIENNRYYHETASKKMG